MFPRAFGSQQRLKTGVVQIMTLMKRLMKMVEATEETSLILEYSNQVRIQSR